MTDMRGFAIFASLFITLSACACEKEQAPREKENVQEETTMNENDKKVLRDWISAFNKAMCEKDVKTLDILMDDDLVLIHMSGATQSKASWLQDIDDETMRYYNIDVTKFECSVEGDRAIVKTTNVIEARIWGSHGTWTLNGTTYLRRADNRFGWIRCNPE